MVEWMNKGNICLSFQRAISISPITLSQKSKHLMLKMCSSIWWNQTADRFPSSRITLIVWRKALNNWILGGKYNVLTEQGVGFVAPNPES